MPQIKYLNKDFASLRQSLIDFAKIYYPNTYSDFNPASPGMMFIDMAAYVGDVLSYYIDDTFKETMLSSAERLENILDISQALGYQPKATTVASTDLDVFMVIPSIASASETGVEYNPDWNYALTIQPGMTIQSSTDSNIYFRTDDYIIFGNSASYEDASKIMVYEWDNNGHPASYLLQKTVRAISATETTVEFIMPSTPKKFHKILLPDTDIIEIISVEDSAGNSWYEVPFLAQDTIFIDEPNTIDPDVGNINEVPYLLRLKRVNKRFTTKLNTDNKIELHFGAGVSPNDDEEIIPNPFNIGSSLREGRTGLDSAIDPSNFLYTKTYGDVPYNTTLTITYLRGGGIKSNVPAKDLTTITAIKYNTDDINTYGDIMDSVACSNPTAAIGGRSKETVEEIRQNALGYYASQQRVVTKEDYITRAYSLPAKYGSIAKAYITQDMQLNKEGYKIPNPLALDLFILGYDANKHLTVCNIATKQNLKTYLNQYRMLTDAINIIDAFIVNIGINFEIVTQTKYNKNEVLLRCINAIQKHFDIDKWQINQPISISDIINLLYTIKGVQNVTTVDIVNKWNSDDGYSGNSYNIKAATIDGVVYPSLDPSIFELKYRDDIKGRAK